MSKPEPAPAGPEGLLDMVAVVLDFGGQVELVTEARADELEASGEGRRATARDLAIAGRA